MTSQGSLFSQTLQDITTTKLDDLAQYRKGFEEHRAIALGNVEKETEILRKVSVLADGVKKSFAIQNIDGRVQLGATGHRRLETDLKNLDRFLAQARYDPSVSNKVLEQWYSTLMKHLDIQSTKYTFASLYGNLTTEWLSQEKNKAKNASEDTEMEDYEKVAGGKKLESRTNWERSVFEPAQVDSHAIDDMLKDLFEPVGEDGKQLRKATASLKRRVRDFARSLQSPFKFNTESLRWTISGLLVSDLLTDEKRAVLRDFESNQLILKEIADVLNMRMVTLSNWSWGTEVQLEERRQVNGSTRIYMHEELLQAIFLQYIGVSWSVFWKRVFLDFRTTAGVWKSSAPVLSEEQQARRDKFLNRPMNNRSMLDKLEKINREDYFVAQLLRSESQEVNAQEGDQEADFEMMHQQQPQQMLQMAQMAQQQTAQRSMSSRQAQDVHYAMSGPYQAQGAPASIMEAKRMKQTARKATRDIHSTADFVDNKVAKSPMELRQNLLHILSADIQIKTRYRKEITCLRSQFLNLYPTLPHLTVKSVLKFFGMPEVWINFFMKFLQAPLRFLDDKDAQPRLRQRGTPGSHVLSEVFSELTLFCLDFQINQVTHGERLWRLHDDFWFWSPNHATCVQAWTSTQEFANIMGLSINPARSGSARISREASVPGTFASMEGDSSLPEGQIRWGMLYLDPQTGHFEIDAAMVDKHIAELSRQLQEKNTSVFSWIQAWNTYASTFFTSNFGRPAMCFGRKHVDNTLATHERIQRQVFANGTGSVLQFLKETIHQRFGVKDVPDGYIFFPTELGGLDLQSPFVGLLQIRDALPADPEKYLTDFEEEERDTFKRAKKNYEQRVLQHNQVYGSQKIDQKEPFLSFEEFTQYREEISYGIGSELGDVFTQLLERPAEESLDCDENSSVMHALQELDEQSGLRGILAEWMDMEPYWKWIAQMYGPEVVEEFGGFKIVDPGWLPMGMVSLLRSGRVKWQD